MNILRKISPKSLSNSLDVSVVVCTKNASNTIVECLKSIKGNNPKEIILVDAYSDDGTMELAEPYVTKIVKDPGQGLAMARNYGLSCAKSKYICNVGPDNVLLPDTLKKCINYLIKNNHIGVSTQTAIKNDNNLYFAYAMNLYKKARYYPGPRSVIGTPHLFLTHVLRKHKFDNKMTWGDDSDMCFRLSKLNYTFGISDTFVYEIGTENINSIKSRWRGYGLGDFEYYIKYSKEWTLKRKIVSFLHPFRAELLVSLFSKRLKIKEKVKILPFLLLITILRYAYWIKYAGVRNKNG